MNSQLSFGLVCFEMPFTYFYEKYMDHSYQQKIYILKCVDLTFKSRTHQGRHVNSQPPDGVDLCQLGSTGGFEKSPHI